jgi:UDP-N-acetylglucosamine 2-epimerase (non-hydrolysing)
MPEEINRVLTDHISDYLFAPTQTAIKNLERENVFGKVVYTGDIAVEIVRDAVHLLEERSSLILNNLKLHPKSYILFTMHRSENTSHEESLISVIRAFEILSDQQKGEQTIVFPIHPRTANFLRDKNLYGRLEQCKNVKLIEPVGYLDFINLIQNANKIMTDSGGVQQEAYLLSVPCITIRKNTEWVETVSEGWNILTDTNTYDIVGAVREWSSRDPSRQNKYILGEGRTSAIIKDFIYKEQFENNQ